MRRVASVALIAARLTWAVPALGQEVATVPADDEKSHASGLRSRESDLIPAFGSPSAGQRLRITHLDPARLDRAGASRPTAGRLVQQSRRRTAKKVAITGAIIAAIAIVFWVTKTGPCEQCVLPKARR